MLRVMIDRCLDSETLIKTQTTAGAALPELQDGDPSNTIAIAAAKEILVYFTGDSSRCRPVNGLALFGISSGLIGGTVGVQCQEGSPIGGDWGAGTYTAEIGSDRLWLPFDETGQHVTTPSGYYEYWMITVTPPSGGSGYLGEVCLGLFEQPVLNFGWGRSRSQVGSITKLNTIGGIEYAYQRNQIVRNNISINWDSSANDQGIHQIRRWYDDTQKGLDPLVIVPDDNIQSDNCYYCRMPSDISEVEQFLLQNSTSLSFVEAIGYEEPN